MTCLMAGGANLCLRRELSSVPARTRVLEEHLRLKPANLYGKKCTISGKTSMERAVQNKPLRLACLKPGGQV